MSCFVIFCLDGKKKWVVIIEVIFKMEVIRSNKVY